MVVASRSDYSFRKHMGGSETDTLPLEEKGELRCALSGKLKVEHNGFPHGVFLIKILTILLLGELPFSTV